SCWSSRQTERLGGWSRKRWLPWTARRSSASSSTGMRARSRGITSALTAAIRLQARGRPTIMPTARWCAPSRESETRSGVHAERPRRRDAGHKRSEGREVSQSRLVAAIESRTACITVIGQGYVGLPLAVEFARAGFPVNGLDTDPDRVAALTLGRSHSPDID